MAGVINLKKAIDGIKEKSGKTYSNEDFCDEYIVSKDLDLFFKIDCCVCETVQRGLNDDGLFVYKAYPYIGYARINLENQLFDLIKGNKSSINISSIAGFYNPHVLTKKNVPALLFSKNLDCDHYNSLDEETIASMVSKEPLEKITLNINDLYLVKTQFRDLLIKLDQFNHEAPVKTANLSDKEPYKLKLHPKEEKSIGLIIAALANLAKIDISQPNGEVVRDKLLPLIREFDPEKKEMSSNTLAKFIEFAIKHTNITTSKSR